MGIYILTQNFTHCKDEKSDHKVGIYCNLIGPLDQSQELHFCAKGSKNFWYGSTEVKRAYNTI